MPFWQPSIALTHFYRAIH